MNVLCVQIRHIEAVPAFSPAPPPQQRPDVVRDDRRRGGMPWTFGHSPRSFPVFPDFGPSHTAFRAHVRFPVRWCVCRGTYEHSPSPLPLAANTRVGTLRQKARSERPPGRPHRCRRSSGRSAAGPTSPRPRVRSFIMYSRSCGPAPASLCLSRLSSAAASVCTGSCRGLLLLLLLLLHRSEVAAARSG